MTIKLKKLKFRPSNLKINPRTLFLLILLVVVIISSIAYITSNIHKTERIFFFPDHRSGKTVGESRKVPRIPFNKEENIDIFLQELLLGPINMNLDPLFPVGTKLEKILFRGKIVYIDLNFMALLPDKWAVHDFENSILLIKKNIKFNFPYVKKIVIAILGQELEIDV